MISISLLSRPGGEEHVGQVEKVQLAAELEPVDDDPRFLHIDPRIGVAVLVAAGLDVELGRMLDLYYAEIRY